MIKVYELLLFILGYDVEKLVGMMFMIDRLTLKRQFNLEWAFNNLGHVPLE